MDFDVSTSSVTEALGELQRKLQSVQEDSELFAALEKKACASFERHRAELTLLLQKERAIHAASEDRLRDDLHRLLLENETMQKQVASLREQRERRCCEETQARRQQMEEREATLRREMSQLRGEFGAARADADAAQREKTWHEIQLREALGRQRVLGADLRRLRRAAAEREAKEGREEVVEGREEGREEEEEEEREAREEAVAAGIEERGRGRRGGGAVGKAFLPPGLPDQRNTTSPASHHIAAIVSTVERQNCYRPRLYYRRRGISSPMDRRLESPIRRSTSALGETRPPPLLTACTPPVNMIAREGVASSPQQAVNCSGTTEMSNHTVTSSGRHLAALCRSLLREILSMRREYQECTAALNDSSVDSVELSRRMRSIMGNLDRKVLQLRNLRQQQAKVEDKLRLHDIMMEIAAENDYCESMYSDLLELIRS